VVNLNPKERILTINLSEKQKKNKDYFERIGVEVKATITTSIQTKE
jgi:hypothetical protein